MSGTRDSLEDFRNMAHCRGNYTDMTRIVSDAATKSMAALSLARCFAREALANGFDDSEDARLLCVTVDLALSDFMHAEKLCRQAATVAAVFADQAEDARCLRGLEEGCDD